MVLVPLLSLFLAHVKQTKARRGGAREMSDAKKRTIFLPKDNHFVSISQLVKSISFNHTDSISFESNRVTSASVHLSIEEYFVPLIKVIAWLVASRRTISYISASLPSRRGPVKSSRRRERERGMQYFVCLHASLFCWLEAHCTE